MKSTIVNTVDNYQVDSVLESENKLDTCFPGKPLYMQTEAINPVELSWVRIVKSSKRRSQAAISITYLPTTIMTSGAGCSKHG